VHPARGLPLGADVVQGAGREHRLGEQHVARSPAPAVEFEATKRATQPPQRHGIRPPDRGGEGVDDLRGVEALTTGDDVESPREQREERSHGGFVAHRQVSSGRVDRHPRAAQHPAQRGRAGPSTHDHRHARPRHPVDEVRGAQAPGDVPGLLGCRPHQVRLNSPVARGGVDGPVGHAADDADVPDDPGRCGPKHRPGAVGGAEGERVRLRPDGEEQAGVRATKGLRGGIRVTDEHQVGGGGPGGLLHEPQPRRGQFLGVIDDDQA
jgi:hypothetical protein